MTTGGECSERMEPSVQAKDRYAACGWRCVAGVYLSADAVSAHCARSCNGSSRTGRPLSMRLYGRWNIGCKNDLHQGAGDCTDGRSSFFRKRKVSRANIFCSEAILKMGKNTIKKRAVRAFRGTRIVTAYCRSLRFPTLRLAHCIHRMRSAPVPPANNFAILSYSVPAARYFTQFPIT